MSVDQLLILCLQIDGLDADEIRQLEIRIAIRKHELEAGNEHAR
jgi:hypothetical protein